MAEDAIKTTPKPFVFVLMPFDDAFKDIYKFGIKAAATEAGAHAERVDEQHHDEGILERIYNQISKADVIVADMSNNKPNVFYEVGYAHALGKRVILVTHKAEEIPFDLNQKSHIVYNGSIDFLKEKLTEKIKWAISSLSSGATSKSSKLEIQFNDTRLVEDNGAYPVALVTMSKRSSNRLKVSICNGDRNSSIQIFNLTLLVQDKMSIYGHPKAKVYYPDYVSDYDRACGYTGQFPFDHLATTLWPLSTTEDTLEFLFDTGSKMKLNGNCVFIRKWELLSTTF